MALTSIKMDAQTFVYQMNNINIPIDEEDYLNYSQQYLDEYKNAYKLSSSGKEIETDNPILKLLFEFDCKKLEIGMLRFLDTLIETESQIHFANFDSDWIVYNKKSKEIEMIQMNRNHVLCLVAQSAETFLSALLTVAQFLSKFGIDEDIADDQPLVCEKSKECSKLAGGEKYHSFYKMLIGCYE